MRDFIRIVEGLTLACDGTEAVEIACACGLPHDLREKEEGASPVAFEDYDLKRKYDAFNQRLFAGTLPDIPISFGKLKGVGGKVDYVVTGVDPNAPRANSLYGRLGLSKRFANAALKPGSMRMTISTTYLRSEQAIDAILLHEMIHVWLAAVERDFADNHGPAFLKKAREISGLVGYQVPLVDKVDGLEVAPGAIKPVGVVLLRRKDGSHSFGLCTPATLRANLDAITARWRSMVPHYAEAVQMVEIASPEWSALAARFPVQRRTDSGMKFWRLPSEVALADLQQNGTVLGTVAPA